MMKMNTWLSRGLVVGALAASATLALPFSGRADQYGGEEVGVGMQHSAGNFGVHGGWTKDRDAKDGNGLVGAHLELLPAPWLGIQGQVDYRQDTAFDVGGTTIPNASLTVRTIPITVSGRLYLPIVPRFSPFALGGAGWYNQRFDYSQALEQIGLTDRTRTVFGWHFGGGANLAVAPRVSLFGEARWIFVDNAKIDVGNNIRNLNFDAYHLIGGLNYYF